MPSDRLTYLGIIRSEGVEMYLAPDGTLRSRGRVVDDEMREWIKDHRIEIIKELRRIECE